MPVPTWDCPELDLLEEPLDTTTVVSEDIWKKFDLDFPDTFSAEQYYGTVEDGVMIHSDLYDRTGLYEKSSPLSSLSRLEAREIRHHDCMWAGLCISKEHNRTLPAKKDVQINSHNNNSNKNGSGSSSSSSSSGGTNNNKKVPAGRSLLINRKPTPTTCNDAKNLESDGDSTRPETPQSCESETDSEDEVPQFKHDSININEKLSEYLGDAHTSAVPVSEVTGQLVRRFNTATAIHNKNNNNNLRNSNNNNNNNNNVDKKFGQRTFNDGNKIVSNGNSRHDTNRISYSGGNNNNNNNNNNIYNNGDNAPNINRGSIVSLGDHCYHLNQTSASKKLDYLGVQTPSDSEEEIDVVTFDKPCRPASLPTNPSAADKQHLQKTVTSALKEKSPPRPRGRPPSNAPRKRSAQTDTKPAKRPKHKTYQKRGKPGEGGGGGGEIGGIGLNDGSLGCRIGNGNGGGGGNRRSIEKLENNTRLDKFADRIEGGNKLSSSDRNECGSSSSNDRGLERNERRGGGGVKSASSSTSSAVAISRSSSDDEPDTEKRSLHNNMERQRRIELRNAFEELRVLVPEVEMKEKAPKVVILRQAAVYCDMLTEIGQAKVAKVTELKRRQDRLRTRLSQLRRSFAAAR